MPAAAWLKHKGERSRLASVLAEIETDKATFELTAPVDGILLETFVDEGASCRYIHGMCVIGAAGESADTVRPAGGAVRRQRRRCRAGAGDCRAAGHRRNGPAAGR